MFPHLRHPHCGLDRRAHKGRNGDGASLKLARGKGKKYILKSLPLSWDLPAPAYQTVVEAAIYCPSLCHPLTSLMPSALPPFLIFSVLALPAIINLNT